MLGGGRYAYPTCTSRVERRNWYDNLVRTALGHGILWRRAQISVLLQTHRSAVGCERDAEYEVGVRLKGSGKWLVL